MADEGELEGVNSGLSGLHVWPALPSGRISSRPGTLMAAAGRWEAEVRGRGGHGAMPHLSRDPVVAASAVVMALQTLVAREVRPTAGGKREEKFFLLFKRENNEVERWQLFSRPPFFSPSSFHPPKQDKK